MKTKVLNRVLVVLSCSYLIFVAFYSHFVYADSDGFASVENGDLVITNLDVSKADAAVIMLDGIYGMIDTGEKSAYDDITSYLEDNNIEKLDFLILTHYDKDHVGCAKKIIENYTVTKVIVPDYISEKKNYEPLQELFATMDNVDVLSQEESYRFGSMALDIYPASDSDYIASNTENLDNDMSLVVSMSYGIDTFLFMADTEEVRMDEMLSDGIDLSANWVKMPHHGTFSDTSANDVQTEILDEVAPEYAIISTSSEKFKGDSAKATKKTLEKDNIEYYCTFDGNVVTTCDGANITVTQDEN